MLPLRSFASLSDFVFWVYEKINGHYPTHLPYIPLYTFGFFVALAFIISSFPFIGELKRRAALGVFAPQQVVLREGEAPKFYDIISTLILGFVLGWKIYPLLSDWQNISTSLQPFLLSGEGNILAGIAVSVLLGTYQWYVLKKKTLPKVIEKPASLYPHDYAGEIIMISAIVGVIGSNALEMLDHPKEYWQDFIQNPLLSLTSGFTVVGGLLFGIAAMIIYARIKKISAPHLLDSIASVFMLAYAIGRQGCQWSGDGDWGIATTPYHRPAFIPDWFWGQTYAHNIINDGQPIVNCPELYCMQLAEPHFPTPVYESIMAFGVFIFLWSVRKKFTSMPGMLVAFFCVGNGLERFFIEFIRETDKKSWALNMSMQQMISLGLIVFGIAYAWYLQKNSKNKISTPLTDE